MKFFDKNITKLNITRPENFYILIIKYLCSKKKFPDYKDLDEFEKNSLNKIIIKAKTKGINYAQFNEILLLLEESRVSQAFYSFFFKKTITLNEIKKGIIKFRGFSILRFGNLRFAYKKLISISDSEILLKKLLPFVLSPTFKSNRYMSRPTKAIDIELIPKNKTQYTGYLSKGKIINEYQQLESLKNDKFYYKKGFSNNDINYLKKVYDKEAEDIKSIEEKALRNTEVYLTWDYLDIYVATSMRNSWEFEETFQFIKDLFKSNDIKRLKLRYFDPTQSQCIERINKGLVESLMLKRADCTIYMTQEYDTLGKDSELASTLAQGKPVIAFIPEINIKQYVKKINKYPLDYFKRKLLILRAEGTFENPDLIVNYLLKISKDYNSVIETFIKNYDNYREKNPFSHWVQKEARFKQDKTNQFNKICEIIASSEKFSYNKRAKVLKQDHPLAVQVHLETGVANGVLVVRNLKNCKNLLKGILLNTLEFEFEYINTNQVGLTLLNEKISNCTFRVVTEYNKLSNSFWNFYLMPQN